jgi:hypothetical protein
MAERPGGRPGKKRHALCGWIEGARLDHQTMDAGDSVAGCDAATPQSPDDGLVH